MNKIKTILIIGVISLVGYYTYNHYIAPASEIKTEPVVADSSKVSVDTLKVSKVDSLKKDTVK